MDRLSILVVEDDALAQQNMADHLRGHCVEFASNESEARAKLRHSRPDICIIDLQLGDEDQERSGLKIIPLARARGAVPAVMSSHDSDAYVEKAQELGCELFFPKRKAKESVGEILARFGRERQAGSDAELFADRFVTVDATLRAAITEALKFAATELPILILGPSGTGKTTLARILHERSGRKGQFVAINCSSYSEDLLEAELFGYKKGAFTDAKEDRKGKLLLADQGTLFLDEIGEMSLKMQTKLLKALEERSFYPLGGNEAQTSSFRIVSATLQEPSSLVAMGRLRLDFYERVHGVTIRLRGLAERPADIVTLLSHFNREGRKLVFSAEAKARLQRHSWPGNVRELSKLVELLKADEKARVTEERIEQLLASAPVLETQRAGQLTEEQYRFALAHGLPALVDSVVEAVIRRNLAENGGTKAKVMAALQISNRLLYKTLRSAPIEKMSSC